MFTLGLVELVIEEEEEVALFSQIGTKVRLREYGLVMGIGWVF